MKECWAESREDGNLIMLNSMLKKVGEPKRLYKFTNSEYLDGLTRFGRIRIGSSAEYRLDDGKDGARSDLLDSTSVFTPGARTIDLPAEHFLRRQLGFRPDLEVQIEFGDKTKLTFMPEILTFCSSYRLSAGLVRRMHTDFGCDAHFIIDRPLAFAAAISAHPAFAGRELRGGYVTYRNYTSEELQIGSDPDPLRKRTQFGWQREYRYFWTGSAPEGVLVEVPEIIPFIRVPRGALKAPR